MAGWEHETPTHAPAPRPAGCWAAYYSDYSAVAIFGTEIAALRHAVDNAMSVLYWEFGKDLRDAVKDLRS